MIDAKLLQDTLGISIPAGMVFDDLGLVSMQHALRLITFIDRREFINEAINNPNIVAAFVTTEMKEYLVDSTMFPILVDEPRWYYYTLFNHLVKMLRKDIPTEIDTSAIVHPTAFVASINVKIGKNCLIEPNVTILDSVEIGDDCIVRAGAVLGINGFEMKRTSRGILMVEHDGKVIIGNKIEIGPNNTIIKGFHYRHTIIGDDTKFDALIHFAHCAQIGKRCRIAAQAMIAGSATIGDDVWIGPNASVSSGVTIGDNAFITLGSVVVKNVPSFSKVTGNFAIPHDKFIANLKKSIAE
jgi:UDP-3-O-[3-hydroxymyristoyl] glucosamine N-acyltransferase